MRSKFIKSINNCHNIWTFYFERPFDFIAGQFIELTLPMLKNDNKRWFTISSSPSDKYLSITTIINPNRAFKSKLTNLQKNDIVDISMPMGDFVLPKNQQIPLVFIAGGIGITPFLSILKDQTKKAEGREINLLYISKPNNFIDSKFFNNLGDKFIKKSSRLTSKEIYNLLSPTTHHYIYIAGPESFVEHLSQDFIEFGVKSNYIYSDFFNGYNRV